jgi:checkpoint serine/threonine-protein kinase
MTLHTRAATDEVLDMFNQTLRNVGSITDQPETHADSDYEDDDYTSAGESTGTGHLSSVGSEAGDETEAIDNTNFIDPDATDARSVSEWTEFTGSKHIPTHDDLEGPESTSRDVTTEEIKTPDSPHAPQNLENFMATPPDDVAALKRPYRDAEQMNQNRLPFMTPIVEMTESSLGMPSTRNPRDYLGAKTPSRRTHAGDLIPEIEDLLLDDTTKNISIHPTAAINFDLEVHEAMGYEAIIQDNQCNPVDDSVKSSILQNMHPPISAYQGYFDHTPEICNKGAEIKKFSKTLGKNKSRASLDKTGVNNSSIPVIEFPTSVPKVIAIKRELGKGGWAPVYLGEIITPTAEPLLQALKAESPPSPWEFHIMGLAHSRLNNLNDSNLSRAAASIAKPYAFHLFADEGYLLESYHDQGTLLDLVNSVKADALASGGSSVGSSTLGLDEAVAMFFSVELLRTLDALHTVGILHGDLKADNCLVRLDSAHDITTNDEQYWDPAYTSTGESGWSSKGLVLIDFGRSVNMYAFKPDVVFLADWKTDKHDCPEQREARPWTIQADLWGAASILHVLLFGKVLEELAIPDTTSPTTEEGTIPSLGGIKKRYKPKDLFKRYWASDIWADMFDVLMNPAKFVLVHEAELGNADDEESRPRYGIKNLPTTRLRECRARMEAWLEENSEKKGLKGALRKIEDRLVAARKR